MTMENLQKWSFAPIKADPHWGAEMRIEMKDIYLKLKRILAKQYLQAYLKKESTEKIVKQLKIAEESYWLGVRSLEKHERPL